MDLGLANATAVVNGGTSGMGRAAAECFAADGARVVVFGRGRERLDETVAALRRLGSPDAVGLAVVYRARGAVRLVARSATTWHLPCTTVSAVGKTCVSSAESSSRSIVVVARPFQVLLLLIGLLQVVLSLVISLPIEPL